MTMSWITLDLAVGDATDTKNHESLREMNVDVVVDVRMHFEETAEMYPYDSVWNLAGAVNCLINHGFKVMLFCEAGQERSPFVAMLCLYWESGLVGIPGMEKAYRRVVEVRPQTLIQDSWMRHLWGEDE